MSDYNIQDYISRINNDLSNIRTSSRRNNISVLELIQNKIRQANPGVDVDFSQFDFTITDKDGDTGSSSISDVWIDNTSKYFMLREHKGVRMRTKGNSKKYRQKTFVFPIEPKISFSEVFAELLPNVTDVYHYDKYDEVNNALQNVFPINGGIDLELIEVNPGHKVVVVQASREQDLNNHDVKAVTLAAGYKVIHFVKEYTELSDLTLNNNLDISKNDILTAVN